MKMIYRCDICNKEFDDFDKCREHEAICKENHATGFRIAQDLQAVIDRVKQAQAESGKEISVGICIGDDRRVYLLGGAAYDPRTRQINLEIYFDDELQPAPEKPDKED